MKRFICLFLALFQVSYAAGLPAFSQYSSREKNRQGGWTPLSSKRLKPNWNPVLRSAQIAHEARQVRTKAALIPNRLPGKGNIQQVLVHHHEALAEFTDKTEQGEDVYSQITRDAQGNLVSYHRVSKGKDGLITKAFWRALEILPDGRVKRFIETLTDAFGIRTEIEQNGDEQTFTDAFGEKTTLVRDDSETVPEEKSPFFDVVYDAYGRKTAYSFEGGRREGIQYDVFGRITQYVERTWKDGIERIVSRTKMEYEKFILKSFVEKIEQQNPPLSPEPSPEPGIDPQAETIKKALSDLEAKRAEISAAVERQKDLEAEWKVRQGNLILLERDLQDAQKAMQSLEARRENAAAASEILSSEFKEAEIARLIKNGESLLAQIEKYEALEKSFAQNLEAPGTGLLGQAGNHKAAYVRTLDELKTQAALLSKTQGEAQAAAKGIVDVQAMTVATIREIEQIQTKIDRHQRDFIETDALIAQYHSARVLAEVGSWVDWTDNRTGKREKRLVTQWQAVLEGGQAKIIHKLSERIHAGAQPLNQVISELCNMQQSFVQSPKVDLLGGALGNSFERVDRYLSLLNSRKYLEMELGAATEEKRGAVHNLERQRQEISNIKSLEAQKNRDIEAQQARRVVLESESSAVRSRWQAAQGEVEQTQSARQAALHIVDRLTEADRAVAFIGYTSILKKMDAAAQKIPDMASQVEAASKEEDQSRTAAEQGQALLARLLTEAADLPLEADVGNEENEAKPETHSKPPEFEVGQVILTTDGSRTTVEETDKVLYDDKGRLLERVSRLTTQELAGDSSFLSMSQLTRRNTGFDGQDRPLGFEIIKETPGGKTLTEKVEKVEYDSEGRILSQISHFTEVSGQSRKEWTAATDQTYDPSGSIACFQRTTREDGWETRESSWDLVYDPSGRLVESKMNVEELDIATGGREFNKAQSIHMLHSFNALGQVSGYVRTVQENGNITTETASDLVYDRQGRLLKWRSERDGQVALLSNSYDRFGRLFSSEQQRTLDGQSVTEKTDEILYDSQGRVIGSRTRVSSPERTYTFFSVQEQFNALGQATKMSRTTVEEHLSGKEEMSGILYDRSGNLAGLTKTVQDEGRTQVDVLEYDAQGQLINYDKLTTEADGRTRREKTAGSRVQIHESGRNLDRLYETDRDGRILRMRSETTEGGRTTVQETLENLSYDGSNHLLESKYQYKETAGSALERTWTVHTRNNAFDAEGRITQYSQETREGGKVTLEQTVGDQRYDSLGRLAFSHLRLRESGEGLDAGHDLIRKDMLYNAQGQLLWQSVLSSQENIWTLRRSLEDMRYDAEGRQVFSRNAVMEKGIRFAYLRIFNRHETVESFNALGQVSERTTLTDSDSAAPARVLEVKESDIKYNSQGQVDSFVSTVRSNAARGRLTQVTREGTRYNALGQAVESFEREFSIDEVSLGNQAKREALTLQTHTFNMQYDSLGRLTHAEGERSWNEVGGGNIAGLDTRWKNTSILFGFDRYYVSDTNRLEWEAYRAFNIPFAHVQKTLEFDLTGRALATLSLSVQNQETSYEWIDDNKLTRVEHGVYGMTSNIATFMLTMVEHYDSMGRADKFTSFSVRDDGNRTIRIESTDIVYNSDGSRKSAHAKFTTVTNRPVDQEEVRQGWKAADILSNWDPRGCAQGLEANLVGLIYNDNQKVISGKSDTPFHYDAFGNVDEKATQNAAKQSVRLVQNSGLGMTHLGNFALAGFTALQIGSAALLLIPVFGVFLQAAVNFGARMAQASAFKQDMTRALQEGLVDLGVDVALGFVSFGLDKLSRAQKITQNAKTVYTLLSSGAGSAGSTALKGMDGSGIFEQAGMALGMNLARSMFFGKDKLLHRLARSQFGKEAHEALRYTVEAASDFIVSTKEAAFTVAAGLALIAAPAIPFLVRGSPSDWAGQAAIAGAVLMSGAFVALAWKAGQGSPRTGASLFVNAPARKIKDAGKAFAVHFSDELGRFGQSDRRTSIRRSMLNIVSMMPVIGSFIPGEKTEFNKISGMVYTPGIHITDTPEAKRNESLFSQRFGSTFQLPALNAGYDFGTVTDVFMGILNLEHSASYDMALKFLESGKNEQGMGYIFVGHSGGAQRSAHAAKILGGLGYGGGMLLGLAGPVVGTYNNFERIDLIGSSKDDFIAAFGQMLSPLAFLPGGKILTDFSFSSSNGTYSHRNIGADMESNPYLIETESRIWNYLNLLR